MCRARFLCRVAMACGLLLAPLAAGAEAETTVEISIEGDVVTENPDPARLNQIPVLGFAQGVSVPYDPTTGLPTGSRRFRPVVFTKTSDKSSPKFNKAISTNDQMDAIFRFYENAGDPTPAFQVTLTGAIAVSLSTSGDADDRPSESISLNFSQIQWTDVASGESHSEIWSAGP